MPKRNFLFLVQESLNNKKNHQAPTVAFVMLQIKVVPRLNKHSQKCQM